MKKILLVLIVIIISSCNQENKLITNNRIGFYKLGELISKDFDEKVFEITLNDNNRIKSIIVLSEDYKTKDGFGVGSELNTIEAFYKESIKQSLNISKGNITIGSIGKSVNYNNIMFVDTNNDNLIDFVWIQTTGR